MTLIQNGTSSHNYNSTPYELIGINSNQVETSINKVIVQTLNNGLTNSISPNLRLLDVKKGFYTIISIKHKLKMTNDFKLLTDAEMNANKETLKVREINAGLVEITYYLEGVLNHHICSNDLLEIRLREIKDSIELSKSNINKI